MTPASVGGDGPPCSAAAGLKAEMLPPADDKTKLQTGTAS